ncbi:VOC family protein [Ornithinicoccus hortensis]|uniref:Catechol 2,3-dioxygenase-like lactoylglutathione lyase family enzyme n=1 Tax=Ornithinicoccus hortensis TaxID=82346 RepID=A0A542YUL7_9MICO|nr:VOC family protein [Ornithinicoccus hortensis]TQL51777.1 catechol 2,3-dioxygenase-like lactoylglutathione lyase family enzyme [Ornithinicoccus hortensis]
MRLHHVQVSIPAGGEDAARSFYGGVLGLAEVPKPERLAARGGVWFRQEGLELHLGVEEPFSPAGKAHPAFAVADVAALAAAVEAAGYPVTWDDNIPGVLRFHTRDGHGNRVELQQETTA